MDGVMVGVMDGVMVGVMDGVMDGAGDIVVKDVDGLGVEAEGGLVEAEGGLNVVTVPRLPNGQEGVIPAQDGGETPNGEEELYDIGFISNPSF
jgi:hypothetical protein